MNKVWVFFYGTFMSASVLEKNGIKCKKTRPAKLSNYYLEIKPKVNIVEKDISISYGG